MVYQQSIQSSIKPELMRHALKRGGCFGAAGGIIIILAGTFLPLNQLKIWGVPLFLLGIALITIGFFPYRKLNRLELSPHKLTYDGDTFLFSKQGKPLFKIAEKSIETMKYVEKDQLYGIGIWLKRPYEEKVRVLQSQFNFAAFTSDSAQQFEGCDLFLPYFTEKAWKGFINPPE